MVTSGAFDVLTTIARVPLMLTMTSNSGCGGDCDNVAAALDVAVNFMTIQWQLQLTTQ